jgi:hypothetical protein
MKTGNRIIEELITRPLPAEDNKTKKYVHAPGSIQNYDFTD